MPLQPEKITRYRDITVNTYPVGQQPHWQLLELLVTRDELEFPDLDHCPSPTVHFGHNMQVPKSDIVACLQRNDLLHTCIHLHRFLNYITLIWTVCVLCIGQTYQDCPVGPVAGCLLGCSDLLSPEMESSGDHSEFVAVAAVAPLAAVVVPPQDRSPMVSERRNTGEPLLDLEQNHQHKYNQGF